MKRVVITGRAALLPELPTPTSFTPQRPARQLRPALLQKPHGMERYARLDRFGQALASVVSAAHVTVPKRELGEGGLSVTSRYANFETNATFHHGMLDKGPRLASPLVFPYTLPGSAASEIAMHFGLGGNYLVWPGGAPTALASVLDCVDALNDQPEQSMTLVSADVLGPALWRTLDECQAFSPFGDAEAAAALCLGTGNSIGQAVGLEGALGAGQLDVAGWMKLVKQALSRVGRAGPDLRQIFSATTDPAALHQENEAWQALGLEADVVRLALRVGDCGASLGHLSLMAALEAPGASLVVASDSAASAVLVVETDVIVEDSRDS